MEIVHQLHFIFGLCIKEYTSEREHRKFEEGLANACN